MNFDSRSETNLLAAGAAVLAVIFTYRWQKKQEALNEVRVRQGERLEILGWAADLATDPDEGKHSIGIALLTEILRQHRAPPNGQSPRERVRAGRQYRTVRREIVSARQVTAARALLELSARTGEPVEQSYRDVAAAVPVAHPEEVPPECGWTSS